MRYLFGFLCVCALVVNLPLSASAQDNEARTTSEPALQLVALDSTGVVFTLISSPIVDGYTLEEMELRVKRAKIGLGVSAGSMVLGIALSAAAGAQTWFCFDPCSYPGWVDPVFAMGMTLAVGGAAGMVVSGILLGKRKRKLRRLQQSHYGTPRRVQWDLAQSRLVF
jgi:hypothetical protein